MLVGTGKFVSVDKLSAGDIIDFRYDGLRKVALVLNPNWEDKLHALKVAKFSDRELTELLQQIGEEKDPEKLYEQFKYSSYVAERPYRTYVLKRISLVRKVFLVDESKKSEPKKEK